MDVGTDRFAVFADLLYDVDLNYMLDRYYERAHKVCLITGEDGVSPLILLPLNGAQHDHYMKRLAEEGHVIVFKRRKKKMRA